MNEMDCKKIIESFESMPWHDAKLLSVCIEKIEQNEVAKLSISFCSDGQWMFPQGIVFEDCVAINMSIDLVGKRACSDSVSDAYVDVASNLIGELIRLNPFFDYRDYFHFKVEMIPPGGQLDIIARMFSLNQV